MNETNKKTLVNFLKVFSVMIFALIAIISGAAVWNAAAQGHMNGFYVAVSIINFIAEGVGIFFYQKAIGAFSDFSFKKKSEEKK